MELHADATNAWNRTNFLPSAINNNGVGSVLTPDSSTNTRAAAQWDRLCLLNYLGFFSIKSLITMLIRAASISSSFEIFQDD
jgi:hypothetical protein